MAAETFVSLFTRAGGDLPGWQPGAGKGSGSD